MAYSHPSLHRVGPSNSAAPTMWTFSTTDTLADVNTEGYFNDAADDLTVGDLIYAAVDTDGSPAYYLLVVLSNSSGVVDVDNGTQLGGTDSD